MTQRSTAARLRPLLVALAVAAPVATALAVGENPGPAVAPSTTPSRIVSEQAGTARAVVPFGAVREDGRSITFAVGQTRGPSPEPAVAPSTPKLVRTTPDPSNIPVLPHEESIDEDEGKGKGEKEGKRLQDIPVPTSVPAVSVLLEGTTRTADAPTAWQRASLPLDARGTALQPGTWRPAGARAPADGEPLGTASAHAGESTPSGAAALLVTVTPEGGGDSSAEVLVRTTGRGFALLPAPPAELLAPATRLASTDASQPLVPIAVFDVAARNGGAASDYGRTGVLLAPEGGDGVLVWDGQSWSEEPYLDADGAPAKPASSPSALAATADGDGVVLVPGPGAAADRVTLLRRLATGAGWQPMTIDAPLLSGPLPSGIATVEPLSFPGDPLTVAPGHWWLDLNVTPVGGPSVAVTVHLTPGPAPQPAGPGSSPTNGGATTAPTDPSTTPTTGPTTAPTTPSETTPVPALKIKATRTWCEGERPTGPYKPGLPDASLCDAELPARFSKSANRGYRSIAFAAQGLLPDGTAPTTPRASSPLGGRVITNPIVDFDETGQTIPDRSASGGYLRLDGDAFTLRGGIGETPSADNLTETAAFLSDRFGWTGGRRVLGHVTTAADPDAGTYIGTTPVSYEPVIDVALSPRVPGLASGAIVLSVSSARRVYDDGRPSDGGDGLYSVIAERTPRTPRAVAWPTPDTIFVAGTNGLLATMPPPESRVFASSPRSADAPALITGFDDVDFTDIAFSATGSTENLDGWAVGRDGVAVHIGQNNQTNRAELLPPLDRPDLREVAFAGPNVYIASSAGLLVSSAPTSARYAFGLDRDLQELLVADGRPADVRTVAGLPDGTVVVDARYVKTSPQSSWQRLPSPAEGDVVALGIARAAGAENTALRGLSVQASIADSPRPRTGELTRRQVAENKWVDLETPPFATDGRHVELTSDGWIDRARTPLDITADGDATVPAIPTQSIAAGINGGGWAATGIGGNLFDDYDLLIQVPRGGITNLATPRIDTPRAVQTARVGADASGSGAAGGSATRSQGSPAPTTPAPTSTSPTTPETTTPSPSIAPAGPGSAPIRILVGGHPACFSPCMGRADQRVAPTESLRQALQTAARLRESGGPAAPRAMVIGGGRTTRISAPLNRPAAHEYVDFLRSTPGTPPVYAALGTGDQWEAGGRETFGSEVVGRLRPTTADGVIPVTDPKPPGGDVVAYAFDVPGADGGAARIVVADTADSRNEEGTGAPSDWIAGDHGRWLDAVLTDAEQKGFPTVVIGAAPIDRDPRATAKVAFLLQRGVYAYVSTDGTDDPYKIEFGLRERRKTIRAGDRELVLMHTSALGHDMPMPTVNRHQREWMTDEADGPLSDRVFPSILELTIPPERASLRRIAPRSIPVFRGFYAAESRPLAVGEAGVVSLPTALDDDNGLRYTDEFNPDAGEVTAWGFGVGDAAPYPCRLWESAEYCGETIDSVGQFTVADTSIADFVRARRSRKGNEGPPQILTDAQGNPVRDSNSPILCPIKPGVTAATATIAGRSVTFPVRVVERPSDLPDPKGTCSFLWGDPDERTVAAPAAKPPAAANPITRVPALLQPPMPQPLPKPTNSPQPPVSPISALPPVAPLFAVPMSAVQEPTPTVAPNPKPFTTPATPSPPTGVNSHAYMQAPSPMMQFQVATAMQEQRREQLARESAEHHATIYRAEPRNPLVPALAGGAALALLAGAAGHAAGRRRALSRAARRSWIS